ncbi:hypothetical protein HAX54_024273 [Datura stramonium]|uniref:Uncharacterized protein n=1 Tax=Datura stramonium TaxID=4076 RepID=A0ABS8UZS1_DATST|nr:hypothetical protein [Datura stramonium]
MEIYMKDEDYQLWLITLKGPLVRTKVKSDGTKVPKTEDEFDADDFRMMEKNAKSIKPLGRTFDEESEGADGEGNLDLMDKRDTDSDNDSSEDLDWVMAMQKRSSTSLKKQGMTPGTITDRT